MALFAKDKEETISAWDAIPGKYYECLECQTPLKLRHSKKKFPHFYHLSSSRFCRLYSKSEKHLFIQYEVRKKNPAVILEKSFPSIQRIADVVWEEKQIVFEIQCSFISEKEAQDRVKEYGSLGYEVVWILYDGRFNQRRVSAAEDYMRKRCCYFVDKNFMFYDQLETIVQQKRIQRGKKIPIQLTPLFTPLEGPEELQDRMQNKYYFENDVLDLSLRSQIIFLPKPNIHDRYFFQRFVRAPYEAFINSLLKIDSRG
ncbi:MAG TPA: competence protein CoiA family protein [Chlamydiales bacterium]|nr:competence protein CoiA family protein [Chlamydiales bacterium]